jgi:hypothetical protein
MKRLLLIILIIPIFLACGRKEKILRSTTLSIDLDLNTIDLTKSSFADHLSLFKNREELAGSFRSMLTIEFEKKGLTILDSIAEYVLVVEKVKLKETQRTETTTNCKDKSQSFLLETVTLEITISLYDSNQNLIESWTKTTNKTEYLVKKVESENENGKTDCENPEVNLLGNLDEYKELKQKAQKFCKKVTNTIVKKEK